MSMLPADAHRRLNPHLPHPAAQGGLNFKETDMNQERNPRIDLVMALCGFVTDLSPKALSLDSEVMNSGGGTFNPCCGAICCAWGWAPNVPALAAEGLVRVDTGGLFPATVWRREEGVQELYWGDTEEFFGLTREHGRALFTWRGDSKYDPAGVTNDERDLLPQITDQVLFRIRVMALLKELGRLGEFLPEED